ncbi:uncharacterized protein LOC131217325 [Magnolia sinica]|uniref:uncharacterized protein LOC131217325 n=1 Tax=Magnolia sinica TaxID=86752 RepID=UPI00265AB29E|nr:uncharacterized protein LOC131217325 [Magnolia sinica]
MQWQIGRGDISFWKDNWTGRGPLVTRVLHPIPTGLKDIQVRDYLGRAGPLPPSAAFNCLPQGEIDAIFQGGFCTFDGPNVPYWPLDPSGDFSINSAWVSCRSPSPIVSWSSKLWFPQLPPKVSMLVWRTLKVVVPVELVV